LRNVTVSLPPAATADTTSAPAGTFTAASA